MATKEDGLFLKQHQSVTNHSNSNKSHQFSELNLNQCNKYSKDESFVHFINSKLNNDKNFATFTMLDYTLKPDCQEKEKTWNKTSKNLSLKTSKYSNLHNEVKEESPKRWMNEKNFSNANRSTLSLHISAYESFHETVLNGSEDSLKKFKTSKFGNSLTKFQAYQDTFEFPRQMEGGGNKATSPEVQQFTSSQKLLSPNQAENDELAEIKQKLGYKERPGFEPMLIEISYRKGPKLGLIIRNYENCVMISRLDAGSLCAEKLVVGDRLVAVDGEAAKDREQTKKIILKGFSKRKKCTFLIERPQSSEAKLWAKTAILSSSTRTSSTAPREKHKWALAAAQQRQAAKLLAAKEAAAAGGGGSGGGARTPPQNEIGSTRSAASSNAISASGKNDSQRKDD